MYGDSTISKQTDWKPVFFPLNTYVKLLLLFQFINSFICKSIMITPAGCQPAQPECRMRVLLCRDTSLLPSSVWRGGPQKPSAICHSLNRGELWEKWCSSKRLISSQTLMISLSVCCQNGCDVCTRTFATTKNCFLHARPDNTELLRSRCITITPNRSSHNSEEERNAWFTEERRSLDAQRLKLALKLKSKKVWAKRKTFKTTSELI